MAFTRNAGFTSAVATDPAATAAGYLTPTRYNLPHTVTDAVSGGIPYFDSTTSEASSALLAENAVVIGGGAGAAPLTSANLTFDGTKLTSPSLIATTGTLAFQVNGSGGPANGAYIRYANLDNFVGIFTDAAGALAGTSSKRSMFIGIGGGIEFGMASGYRVGWSSSAAGAGDAQANIDTGLSRVSAGVVGVGTGAAASVAGSLSMNNCKAVSYTVGTTAGASGTFTSVTVVNGIVTSGT